MARTDLQQPPQQQQQQPPQPEEAGVQQQIYFQPHIEINVPQVAAYAQPQPQFQYQPPPAFQYQPPPPVACPPQALLYGRGWRTGLFDCMDDLENAIITLCCPCVTFGQIAHIIDNGRTSCETAGCIYTSIAVCIAMPCIYSYTYRTRLRSLFGLDETPASDCLIHLCCEYCALCQEYRELNHRGFNPSSGWMNQSMHLPQQQGMVPPTYQIMR